ncbi:MAG: FAD-dependent oxidoreductase [Deltaproteobacteria bacterium]|nr:FAD-dependent oxidoreductase [Deltaproteobacteria bacterium]
MTQPPRQARLVERVALCQTISEFWFEAEAPLGQRPGQYIAIVDPTDANRTLPFSVASSPRTDGRFRLCLRRGQSPFLQYLFGTSLGSELLFVGPAGRFVLPDDGDHLLLVAVGTGITPFCGMREQLGQRLARGDRVILLHGVAHVDELIDATAWHQLEQQQRGFSYRPTLSRQRLDGYATGRVTAHLPAVDGERRALLCGSEEMLTEVKAALFAQGWQEDQITTEW